MATTTTSARLTAAVVEGNALVRVSDIPPHRVRNFSIIAHVDHGKSTLADRLLELTGVLDPNAKNKQFMDKLEVEQERGITVKAQTATLFYYYKGEEYMLNLIDTPGHVDFNYEVSRSLAACQGALLLVDSTQGVQAQTVANYYLAHDQGIKVIPVMNKIDMPAADIDLCSDQLLGILNVDPDDSLLVSAKTGEGVDTMPLDIVEQLPPPLASPDRPLRALLFDTWFDTYRGVICLFQITDGSLKRGQKIISVNTKSRYEVQEVGIMHPERMPCDCLGAGHVGYAILGMKDCREARVGDTMTLLEYAGKVDALPGFKPAMSVVFAGIFPADQTEFDVLKNAIERLTLNDPSVSVSTTTSNALGTGFTMGFLGMLHMEVFAQRLEQEHGERVITTRPTVTYKAELLKTGKTVEFVNPSEMPPEKDIRKLFEPVVDATIIVPEQYQGKVMSLCQDRRGQFTDSSFGGAGERAVLHYKIPLIEVASGMYNEIKAVSSGFASFDYVDGGYQEAPVKTLEVMVNGEEVDALSCIVPNREDGIREARVICERLKKLISRHQFDVRVQAKLDHRIVASETIKALRKDVTAKCYGGDQSRKRKLLEQQKKGKEKMRAVGNVQVPNKVFGEIFTMQKK